MKTGYVRQTGEFDSEILRSSDFQLMSITLDDSATYGGNAEIPKGALLVKQAVDTDGTYRVLSTASNYLNSPAGDTAQYIKDLVVLAETIKDASAMDQPVKAYLAGTFDLRKLVYDNMGSVVITATQWAKVNRIKVVDIEDTT